jgi:NADH-quinone oxidoreductase subunit L
MIYSAIVFLPGLAALFVGLLGRALGARPSELITSGALIISCILSWIVFWHVGFGHETAQVAVERWITSGELD